MPYAKSHTKFRSCRTRAERRERPSTGVFVHHQPLDDSAAKAERVTREQSRRAATSSAAAPAMRGAAERHQSLPGDKLELGTELVEDDAPRPREAAPTELVAIARTDDRIPTRVPAVRRCPRVAAPIGAPIPREPAG